MKNFTIYHRTNTQVLGSTSVNTMAQVMKFLPADVRPVSSFITLDFQKPFYVIVDMKIGGGEMTEAATAYMQAK